jgi:hypothetical protein
MRVMIATDAWQPQVNGVVRTLQSVAARLRGLDVDVEALTPDGFISVPVPAYPSLRFIRSCAVGLLSQELQAACLRALTSSGASCREYAQNFSWDCARQFFSQLQPFDGVLSRRQAAQAPPGSKIKPSRSPFFPIG